MDILKYINFWDKENLSDINMEPDPNNLSVNNAYKTRWVWYHTILAVELLLVNILLIAILEVLSIQL